jgi:hypothetical protein
METVIKVNPSELDSNLLNKIKKFIGKNKNVDVTISLREFDAAYSDTLNQSIEQAEEEVVSMTMEEFFAYTPDKKK